MVFLVIELAPVQNLKFEIFRKRNFIQDKKWCPKIVRFKWMEILLSLVLEYAVSFQKTY